MTDQRDPDRLADAAETPEELQSLMRTLRRGGEDREQRARIAAALGPLLQGPGPPGGGGTSGTAGGGGAGLGTAMQIGIAVTMVGLGAVALVVWRPWEQGPGERAQTQSVHTAPAPALAEELPAAPPQIQPAPVEATAVEVAPSVPSVEEPRERSRERLAPARPSAPAGGEPSVAPPTEIELLRPARRDASRRPAEALALVERHQTLYPDGYLAEEREVIAVEALVALGREGPARERAARFLARHPASAHRARLDALLRTLEAQQ